MSEESVFYEETVDEYIALIKGPPRVVGRGRMSPPLTQDMLDRLVEFQAFVGVAASSLVRATDEIVSVRGTTEEPSD